MIPRSKLKLAIITEIESDVGRINAFSRLPIVLMMLHFDLLS